MDGNRPDPEDLGHLERRDGQVRLRFTRRLRYPPQTVWRALTDPEHLAAWFPTTIEGERAAGARLRFSFRDMEADPIEGEMLAFEPPSRMELRWGVDILRFEVEPHGDECVLVFTATVDELGRTARDGAGWHSCLDLLGFEVAAQAPPFTAPDRWKALRSAYVDRFGPEASTMGPPPQWEDAHGREDLQGEDGGPEGR
ncbi:MAG TPA: SRPBCC family protein [Acidimicrobiales bacterium]|nr:SRPBCC family protein [Acidimicrobiales bacterium]